MILIWLYVATAPRQVLKPLDIASRTRDAIDRKVILSEPKLRTAGSVALRLPSIQVSESKSLPLQRITSPTFGPIALLAPRVETLIPSTRQIQTGGASPVLLDLKNKQIEDTICDVVCSNTDLYGVLQMLSATTKANLVAVATTDQKLTLSLRRVRLAEALKHISSVIGMSYLRSGSTFLIGPEERLKAAYPVEWAKANPVAQNIGTQQGGSTKVDPDTIKEPPIPVEETITRTYFSSYTLADGLKATLKELYGEELKVAVGPASVTPTLADRDTAGATGVSQGLIDKDGKPIGRAVVVNGKKSRVLEAIEVMMNLDQPRAQVAIMVTIHDIADNALKELGVSWDIGGTTMQETDPKGINFGSFTRTPFNFGATIKALETIDKANLLASPNVTVLDGERAFVLIGNKITLPKFTGYNDNNVAIFDTSEYKVGIYLQVAATVSGDGTITMSIYPQVSTVVRNTQINGAQYPDIATREAQTSLRVRSGQTIVLAGLLRSEEMTQVESVPLLSQIPLFGELFKRRRHTKTSSQVVISLTPTLIPPTSQ